MGSVDISESYATYQPTQELSSVVIPLLKGVLYQEDKPELWNSLLRLREIVQNYISVLGLDLRIDESEGYAFLQSKEPGNEENDQTDVPRLVARRQLSYPLSLLLVVLRKKLGEFDINNNGDTRLILSRDEIVELVQDFLPVGSNEARLIDNIDANLNKIADMGFIRRLHGQKQMIEVRRIIKAFIDAQWLDDFRVRMEEYQRQYGQLLQEETNGRNT